MPKDPFPVKILDKYVVKSYVWAYIVSFISMMMMVILFDFVLNIDEFFGKLGKEGGPQTVGEVAINICRYYGWHTTQYFAVLSGFITVIAAGFVLGRMSFSNELTAILASGVSLHRVMLPVGIVGVILSLLLVVDNEIIMPALREKLVLQRADVEGKDLFEVAAYRDERNNLTCGVRFDPIEGKIFGVTIIMRTPPPRPGDPGTESRRAARVLSMVHAETAQWVPDDDTEQTGCWKLEKWREVIRDEGLELAPDKPLPGREAPLVRIYRSSMTPRSLRLHNNSMALDFLSYRELDELVDQPQIPNNMRSEIEVRKHLRITQPIVNILLMLTAVPFFLTRESRERKNLVMAAALCIGVVGGGMGFTFAAAQWAFEQNDPFWYLGGAWAPIAFYSPLAVLTLESIKT